jgi:hypothetical protein
MKSCDSGGVESLIERAVVLRTGRPFESRGADAAFAGGSSASDRTASRPYADRSD